jgi:Domain of unknown function (DUF4349)
VEDRLQSLAVRFRALSAVRRGLLYAAALLFAIFILVLLAPRRGAQFVPPATAVPRNAGTPAEEYFSATHLGLPAPVAKEAAGLIPPPVPSPYRTALVDAAGTASEPRIAYSAELSVATREFVRSRASLEEILERHRGYVAKLRMVGQPAGSLLSATLRIPSSEYSSTLSDLKSIGRVEREEESADEITQQHGDLEARLMNAQNTEQRWVRMLQNPPAKGMDPAMFERQLAALRAQIVRMQAERQAYENRAVFSSVFFSLREEIASPAVTLGAQLREAAINGFSGAASSLSTILLFVMNYGPLFFLWAVILFLPARFVWRRSRPLFARASS